jgi:hypothetical protein
LIHIRSIDRSLVSPGYCFDLLFHLATAFACICRAIPPDGHGSNGLAERVGNSAVTLWRPDLLPSETAAVDTDELRRQGEKARIRERILREEAEHWELELEVRSELREQMLQLSWPALGRPARGSGTPTAVSPGTITAANSSLLPVVALEVCCLFGILCLITLFVCP